MLLLWHKDREGGRTKKLMIILVYAVVLLIIILICCCYGTKHRGKQGRGCDDHSSNCDKDNPKKSRMLINNESTSGHQGMLGRHGKYCVVHKSWNRKKHAARSTLTEQPWLQDFVYKVPSSCSNCGALLVSMLVKLGFHVFIKWISMQISRGCWCKFSLNSHSKSGLHL